MRHLFKIISIFIIFFTSTFALTLSDDFEINDGGWLNTQGLANPGGGIATQVLELTKQPPGEWNYKIYDLGIGFANTVVNVQLDMYGVGGWETTDLIWFHDFNANVTTFNNFPNADGNTDPISQHLDYNVTTDANGLLILYIYPDPSNAKELLYIDNISISTNSDVPTMAPIPDSTMVQYSPYSLDISGYVSEPDGDPILYYSYSCPGITGLNFDSQSGLLSGNPTNVGTFTCSASATDKDGQSNVETFVLNITAGASNQPPIIATIPPLSFVVNTPLSIDLSNYVIATDGDAITAYALTGTLPSGLSFDTTNGIISGLTTSEGNVTLALSATDKDGDSNASSFLLSIVPAEVNTNYRDFALRYQQTFAGKMYTIGNTILVAPKDQNETICQNDSTDVYLKGYTDGDYQKTTALSNDQYELCEYYADKNEQFATTKATLPSSASGINAKVKWAGLYWQALVKNDYAIESMKIQFKHSSANYVTIDYATLDYNTDAAISGYTNYSAFADVTSYFVDNNLTSGDIYVGDIPVVEGKIKTLGTYGAWTLVLIYEDPAEALQNFSIYDGWQKVDSINNAVNISINGFFTPKNAPDISAQVSVFAAEGDKLIPNDELKVKPSKQATFTTLTTFDSSIQTAVAFQRKPDPSNNQGIDIQSFELGTAGQNIILPEESSMELQFTSSPNFDVNGNIISNDTYWPSMVAFSAQLYLPQVCYDYTVSMGDQVRIPSNGRDINSSTYGGLPLKIEFLLRSEEADFVYFDTKANISFTNPSNTLTYNNDYAAMSPANANVYFKYKDGYTEIENNASNGQLALGSNVIGNAGNNGGILTPKQTTYAILGYDVVPQVNDKGTVSTHFDIHFEASIRFDAYSQPVTFEFSTHTPAGETNHVPRCPTNPIYNPIPLGFNVERVGSRAGEDVSSRFTLHTQVTGRPYAVDLVTYQGGVTNASNIPLDYRGVLELEVIDGSAFQNDSGAGYDTTCQRPNAIGTGTLIAFEPLGEQNVGGEMGRHTVQIPTDLPGYIDTQALQNAAFRLWVVTVPDNNGSNRVITHQCTDRTNSDDCFGNLYRAQIDVNATGNCVSECAASNSGCYTCLKTYYTTAICSRDNFAIRPESFLIKISDDDDDTAGVTPAEIAKNLAIENTVRLAAGYDYRIDIDTTTYGSNTQTTGYFNSQFVYADNMSTVPDIYTAGSVAMLEFNDAAACFDKNQSTIALSFENGAVRDDTHFRFPNVGRYKMWVSDSNWTIVDHADYIYKPFPNVPDCDASSTNTVLNTLAGCTFYSVHDDKLNIDANVQPYRFGMSGIQVVKQPNNAKNYTFYNDFNSTYYNDLLAQPINTSVSYIGLLVAKDMQGKRVSNYTQGCAAQDVVLDVNITTTPNNTDALSPLQQYLQHTSSIDTTWNAKATGLDANITLTKSAFPDATSVGDGQTIDPGEARVLLHTTFTKPKDIPINPILSLYNGIDSTSLTSNSKAHMGDHVPVGSNTNSDNLIYYFAKVRASLDLYDNVTAASRTTPLFVDIYCSLGDSLCNTTYNLNIPSQNAAVNWYSAAMYDSVNDGNITALIPTKIFGQPVTPSVSPNTNVAFIDSNASRSDVNVSVAGTGRPSTIGVSIQTPPWLSYNPDDLLFGYPTYRVRFIGNSSWSGVGNTGKVVETTSSTSATKRMNW